MTIINDTITNAIQQFSEYRERIKGNGMLGFPSCFPEIDKAISGIIPGKVYCIGAFANTGKSKLSYFYLQDFLKKGKRCIYFSLEVDLGMLIGQIIESYYNKSYGELNDINERDFYNLYLYDDIYTLKGMEEKIQELKPDIIFIDFIQNVKGESGSIYERMANVAINIQQLGIKYGCTIFTISQISNSTLKDVSMGNLDTVVMKGAGEIMSNSDVVMFLKSSRNGDDETEIHLTLLKNKYGPAKKKIYMMRVDYKRNQFNLYNIENLF